MENTDTRLEKLDKADLLRLVKQMVQLYPDLEELIASVQPEAPKQQRIPLNAALFRRQVEEIFYETDRDSWGSEGRAAEPLLRIRIIADNYLQQGNYADAATIYSIIVKGILDNYDTFRWHADEGDLDDVVEECVEGLGKCLKAERNDAAVRQKIIEILFEVYTFDQSLENDMPVMSEEVPALLTRHTTPEERRIIAAWTRDAFDLDIDWNDEDIDDDYDEFLLGLEADTLDDETYLSITRKMQSYPLLIDRLLKLGRVQEAFDETKRIDDYYILEVTDIFSEYGHDDLAMKMIEERAKNTTSSDVLHWLKKRYEAKHDLAGNLDMAFRLIRLYPGLATLENYKEVRQIAQQLNQWETVQAELLALLNNERNIDLQIRIAIEEDQIDKALALLHSQANSSQSGPYGSVAEGVGIEVANAAEASHPEEALDIYKRYIERRIGWRGRENYQTACQYLINVRKLYQKLNKNELWVGYIAELRERNRNLPALKDELAKARL